MLVSDLNSRLHVSGIGEIPEMIWERRPHYFAVFPEELAIIFFPFRQGHRWYRPHIPLLFLCQPNSRDEARASRAGSELIL